MEKDDKAAGVKPESQQEPDQPESGGGPLWDLRNEIDGLFEDFSAGAAGGQRRRRRRRRRLGWGHQRGMCVNEMSIPNIDVIDKKTEIRLSAELPGMDESDIAVEVSNGVLTISGEKKQEVEDGDKQGDYYMSERSYGSFNRTLSLPDGIDQDKIEAQFKKGVLTVHLPKKPEAQAPTRRIEVKAEK